MELRSGERAGQGKTLTPLPLRNCCVSLAVLGLAFSYIGVAEPWALVKGAATGTSVLG